MLYTSGFSFLCDPFPFLKVECYIVIIIARTMGAVKCKNRPMSLNGMLLHLTTIKRLDMVYM